MNLKELWRVVKQKNGLFSIVKGDPIKENLSLMEVVEECSREKSLGNEAAGKSLLFLVKLYTQDFSA